MNLLGLEEGVQLSLDFLTVPNTFKPGLAHN